MISLYVENRNLHDYPVSIYLDNEQDNQPDNTFISCQNTTKMATFMYLTEQKENQALLSLFMTLIAIK